VSLTKNILHAELSSGTWGAGKTLFRFSVSAKRARRQLQSRPRSGKQMPKTVWL